MLFKEKDPLLKGKSFCFSVDKLERINKNVYEALLIPNIESEFFPPYHTRTINVSNKLLDYDFTKDHYPNDEFSENYFLNDIKQGYYYEIPSEILKRDSKLISFDEGEFIIEKFFGQFNKEIPYLKEFRTENKISVENAGEKIRESRKRYYIYPTLYCFNAGQGDFNLFISSNGNPYIIDTNIYFSESLNGYINRIKKILRDKKLDDRYIRGIIVTHQHIDHIRGLAKLMDSNEFDIDYFIINNSYNHKTKAVENLYISAQRIPNWINSDNKWEFLDGDTYFCFKNPDSTTRNSPDINNSSISICIRDLRNDNLFYLTGDTGFTILENCYQCPKLRFKNSVLKVSHHGSITGTSLSYLDLIYPKYAFISAGQHRKFNHPHKNTLDLLKFNNVDIEVSRYNYYSYVEYESTNQGINKKCVSTYD